MPYRQGATVTLSHTNKLVSLLNPRPDSSVVERLGANQQVLGSIPSLVTFPPLSEVVQLAVGLCKCPAHRDEGDIIHGANHNFTLLLAVTLDQR